MSLHATMKHLLLLFFTISMSYAQVYVPDSQFNIPLKPADTVATTYLSTAIKNKYVNEYLIRGEIDFLDNKPVKKNIFHCIRYIGGIKNIATWDSIGYINDTPFLFTRKNGNYILLIENVINEVNFEGRVVKKIDLKRKYFSKLIYEEKNDKIYFTSDVKNTQYLYTLDFDGKLDSTFNKESFNILRPCFIKKYDEGCSIYKTNEKYEIDTTFQKIPCPNGDIRITNVDEIISIDYRGDSNFMTTKYSAKGQKKDSLILKNINYSSPIFYKVENIYTNKQLIQDYTQLDVPASYKEEIQYLFKHYLLQSDSLGLQSIDDTLNLPSYIFSSQLLSGYALTNDGNLYYNRDYSKTIVNCKKLAPYNFRGLRRLTDSTFLGLESNNIKTNYIFFTNKGKRLFDFPNTKFSIYQNGHTLLTDGDTLFHVMPDLKLYKYKDTLNGKAYYVDFEHQFLYQVTTQKQILKFSLQTQKQDLNFKINENLSFIKHISFYKNGDLAISAFSDAVQNFVLFLKINSSNGNTIIKINALPGYTGEGGICNPSYNNPYSPMAHKVLNDEKNILFSSISTEGSFCGTIRHSIVNLETTSKTQNLIIKPYFDESDNKEKTIDYSYFDGFFVISDLLTSQRMQTFQILNIGIRDVKKAKDGFITYGLDKIYKLIDKNTPYLFTDNVLLAYQTPKKYKIPYYYRGTNKVKFEIIEGKSSIEGDSLVAYQGVTPSTQSYADVGKIKISAADIEPVILPYYINPDKKRNEVVVLADEPETDEDFKIYPNPVNGDRFEIETLRNIPIKNITLTDMQGKTYVPLNSRQGNKYLVHTTVASDGVYILSFEYNHKKIKRVKLTFNH